MKKVLLSCLAIAAGAVMAIAQDEPIYPSSLDFTLNGEKELPGVTVSQTMDKESLEINITGKSEANVITMDFVTPDGWDYALIKTVIDDVNNPFSTRSSHWLPVSLATKDGYTESNSFRFSVNGKDNYGTIYLVSGDNVWEYPIDIVFNVSNASGSGDDPNTPGDDPVVGDEPLIPESIGVTASVNGLSIEQEKDPDDGTIYIDVTGTITESEYDIVLGVPEGWDGFLIDTSFSNNMTVGKPNVGPKKISATDHDWVPIEYALAEGYVKGNKLTSKASGNWEYAFAFLYKGEQVDYNAYVSISAKVSQEETGDDDVPAYPEALDITLNGEKELTGVTVTQEMIDGALAINVKGSCEAESITMTFATPEGWDGLVISAPYAEVSDIQNGTTRSQEDWFSMEYLDQYGYVPGNTVTFECDGIENWAYVGLVKDNMVYQAIMDVTFNVSNGEPVIVDDEPEFPESIGVNTFDDGLTVDQEWDNEYACQAIYVTGKVTTDEYTIVLDVPEGWTGFIGMPYDENVTIGDYQMSGPRKTRSMDHDWCPIEDFEEMGYVKGDKFTFKTNAEDWEMVDIFLYKDDQVDYNAYISLMAYVTKYSNPEFPEKFNITFNGKSSLDLIEATQGEVDGVYTINVSGITLEENVTVALDVPAGWDGFVSIKDEELNSEISPLTRAYESEWVPVNSLLEVGFKESNQITFAADGEEHSGMFYLVKDGEADEANQIMVEFNVSNPTVGVAGVETIDTNARYYDFNGRQIAKPAPGMYIKVLNGKASKVTVK